MPEVKWAPEGMLCQRRNQFYNTPVLTLDQIEAWLKEEDEQSQLDGERGYVSCRALLAQVQAWQEKK